MDGFGYVLDGDVVQAVHVGEGAADAQDLIVCSCGKAKLVDRSAEQVFGGLVESAVLLDQAWAHVRIEGGGAVKPFGLRLACLEDLGA